MHDGHQRCNVACRKLLDDLVLIKNTDRTTVVQYLAVKVSQAAFKHVVLWAHNCYWMSRSCTNFFKEAAGRLLYKHASLLTSPTARACTSAYAWLSALMSSPYQHICIAGV